MSERLQWRAAPTKPYRCSGNLMFAPADILSTTVQVLQSNRGLETACFWLGTTATNGSSKAFVVVVPRQINRARNFSIPGNSMLQVAELARPREWTVVAAIHSHPGDDVEHSEYDDQMTASRRALSIVFPQYGKWRGPWAKGVGVHEYMDQYWHLLPEEDAKRRIEFSGREPVQVVDLR